MMKDKYWQIEEFDEFDDQLETQKKKANKQNTRKWREIEAYKDRRREQRELAYFDSFAIIQLYIELYINFAANLTYRKRAKC